MSDPRIEAGFECYPAGTADAAGVVFLQRPLRWEACKQRGKDGSVLDGETGSLAEVGGYRVGRISEQHDLASRERRHRIEIENVGPNQRVWSGATEHLRDRLMKVCKEGSDALQIQLGQSGIISSSSAAAGKPVDSVAWDGSEAEPLPRSLALAKPGRIHPAWHTRRNGPPARVAGKMLA